MPSRLAPCPSCTRHVKVGADTCVFCGGAVPIDVPARVVRFAGRPISRAVLMFGAVGAVATSACSSSRSTTPPETVPDAGPDFGHGGAAYGVAVFEDASTQPLPDATPSEDADPVDGGPGDAELAFEAEPAYGVAIFDAGIDVDAHHYGASDAAYGVFIDASFYDAKDAGAPADAGKVAVDASDHDVQTVGNGDAG